jgi:hypothetical protein
MAGVSLHTHLLSSIFGPLPDPFASGFFSDPMKAASEQDHNGIRDMAIAPWHWTDGNSPWQQPNGM